ncbi:site-specific DNA-methyltransferase [Phocaeicola barnesiae]|uniref:site-specific DNA-methyltransferase n=1 Tax=Phocaeicola barnesiae TaxID=376804 RepID=UPI0024332177|nr:site-specific DNA-methyltransferase [Phocaeicola barnesiae]
MDRLKMQSLDVTGSNIKKIQQLFPNCVTERLGKDGKPELAIDFEKLQAELSNEIIGEGEERYQFTWPDKRAANRLANTPTTMTLRPCREESVDFDHTQNLYIEGDNLDVLKVLRETYLGKVKMIYIDPPYNTGNDFVYNDDFAQSRSEFEETSGLFDEEGNQTIDPMQRNTESNGRFHTDWLNMMYPRLKVARDLLTDEGVIFISIGQVEITNLIKECDEIFGSTNRISIVSRLMKSGGGKGQFFSPNVEYMAIYAKNISNVINFREEISEEIIRKLYTSTETEGERKGEKYRPFGLYQASLDPLRGCTNQRYYIEAPDGTLLIPPGKTMPLRKEDGAMVVPKSKEDKVWRWSKDRYLFEKANHNIEFKKSHGVLIDSEGNPANWNVYTKIWLTDRQEEGATPVDIITRWENRQSAKELLELGIPFDFAKPIGLIRYLITLMPNTFNSIILDFFSGSATTAHAVMQLNAEDGGNRNFIMVQLPEKTDEKSEAYKAGYKNICEIGKERIRRAGKKIKEENKDKEGIEKLDTGFRVLKLDSSNMNDVYYTPEDFDKHTLFSENVKSDRTPEDLLFQVMLDLGIELSAKIESRQIAGKTVYLVDDYYLVACFDRDVTEATITEIAKLHPVYFVMRDASAANDSVIDNFEQLFEAYSKDTVRKIL